MFVINSLEVVNSVPDVEFRSAEASPVDICSVVVDICAVLVPGVNVIEVLIVDRESFSSVAVEVELAWLLLPEVTSYEEIPARPSNTEPA